MRILITNNHLEGLGGTETWVMTMVKELAKEHEVGVYTLNKGYVASLLADYIDDDPKGYDLALINHNTCKDVDAKFKIFTTHGTFPALEKPPIGMDYYVAVSENTAKHHEIPHIIRNPIDTELFSPTSPIRSEIKQILDVTSKGINMPALRPSIVENTMPELINQCDLVVSMGRGALEAMSCGRAVIVYDQRYYLGERGDGYITPIEQLTGNVAGKYANTNVNLQEELKKYDHRHGEKNREYILKHHDVRNIAKEYLQIWQTATKKGI